MDKLDYLIGCLCDERHIIPPNTENTNKFDIYRSLVNMRAPGEASQNYLDTEDEVLKSELQKKGIVDISSLPMTERNIILWKGDITTLRCDAIVNAANSEMTGCYVPGHNCIDNCIHTYAGTRLRLCCDRLMKMQGYPEPAGTAKITPAFNLPCKYVIHTVGPQVKDEIPTDIQCRELAGCYRSCLEIAEESGCKNIAFCCISTGIFGFPKDEAASIAVNTVRKHFQTHSSMTVVFNVFTDEDLNIYKGLLKR